MMFLSRLRQASQLTSSSLIFIKRTHLTSDFLVNTTRGLARSSTSITPFLINRNSSWLRLVQEISEITLTSKSHSIIGLTKTEFTMNMRQIFVELKYTCLAQFIMLLWLTWADFTQLLLSEDSMDGQDMIVTHILKSIFQKFLQEKSFKSFGMVHLSSSED